MHDIQFSLGNGIAIKFGKQTILLDPKVSDFISFVSHAHGDHSPQHIIKKPYCTEETYELIKVRNPEFEANIIKEGRKINFDNFSVKLISSGHILGATQTYLELDGVSILYTGDIKLSQGLTSKPITVEQADILITEATYGHPEYQLPPIAEVREQIVSWVNKYSGKYNVNLGAYPVGKSQEAIKLLNQNGIVPQVTEGIKRYCEIYKKFGINLEFFEEKSEVSVKPINIIYKINSSRSKNCVLTGWSAFRDNGMFGFPLSDHSDFNQLLEFIQQVNPKKVYCVHGFERELSQEIRKKLKIPAEVLQNKIQRFLTDF